MRVLVGVAGGIAAYKSADLVRRLRDAGHEVRVVMTRMAQRFVGALALQAVSGYPVRTDVDDSAAEAAMGHIELARWAELLIIAPATANVLAKLAAGIADDLLTTLVLATRAPIAVAPAMNSVMWENAATQANIALLAQRGVMIWGPGVGSQACGEEGAGRMLEPLELADRVAGVGVPKTLAGNHVVITAGPTREALDPVRFLSNRSSGKMGYAMAEAAVLLGAQVTLISGPTSLPPPLGVKTISVLTAAQMHEAVMSSLVGCDIFIGAAAVADYTPKQVAVEKIKKSATTMMVELQPTIDIIAAVAVHTERPWVVGFAAETENVLPYARAKRERKGLDAIIANAVNRDDVGFESDENEVCVIYDGGERVFGKTSKRLLAIQLMQFIAEQKHAQSKN